ncbi:NADH-quinone oxidoreductase subunit C [Streptomyces sp. cg40]|uniref:NADH-quinone oxidoreductase subunit C n=1 Tax=Streptomyces sp. cg40 TaxID=3419764 RepID=UPI003CFFCDB7
MTAVGWLPAPTEELFGTEATAEESYELLTVDVPPTTWLAALRTARDDLGCTYFDWLSAVDEPGTGFRVSAHVVALSPVRRLLVRTTVPHEAPVLPTAVDVYAGAAWHERETHEMFGVDFEGHPALDHLLLPETFEGHPLRKDFVLAARVAKAWPGAKEPGESDHGGPKRRQMLPPGVPDPNEWGPLKGQLPPAPARPARGTARAAGDRPVRGEGGAGDRPVRAAAGERPARAAGDRPVRRARTAAEGSASQATPAPATATESAVPPAEGQAAEGAAAVPPSEGGPAVPSTGPRRARSASEGSASQIREAGTGTEAGNGTGTGIEAGAEAGGTKAGEPASGTAATPRRARSAAEGSASQQPTGTATPRRSRSASDGSASQQGPAPVPAAVPAREDTPAQPTTAPRSPDAPWHHARPAFDGQASPSESESEAIPQPEANPQPVSEPDSTTRSADGPPAEAEAEAEAETASAAADPTPEGQASEDPTPDTPAGGPQ